MSDFQNTKTQVARKERRCPECKTDIAVGQAYVREAGRWDGDFYSAVMCVPCRLFLERYVSSMELCSSINWDEVSYTFGDIVLEAAEFAGYQMSPRQPLPGVRDAVMAMFDGIDNDERDYQKRERENIRRAKIQAERFQQHLAASRRIVLGMSACGALALGTTAALAAETLGSACEHATPQGERL